MNKETTDSILILSNDDEIIKILKNSISKTFPNPLVNVAGDGISGWEQVQRYKPDFIISEFVLPGFTGLQLLQKIRINRRFSDIHFIMLINSEDKVHRQGIYDEGADSYFEKPLFPDEISVKLNFALKKVRLQRENSEQNELLQELAEELENNINDTLKLAQSLIRARMPETIEMLDRIVEASNWIARQLGGSEDDDLADLESAAQICIIGKMFLPDSHIKKPVFFDGMITDDIMLHVPVAAREITSSVRRFKGIGETLYHLFENFDGSGFPGKLKSWQIPYSSRIIRVVLDYEERLKKNRETPETALAAIQRESKRIYDGKIVILFEQYLTISKAFSSSANEQAIQLQEMKQGMTIARDVVTYSGLKLLPSGIILKDDIIAKILAHNANDPILGHIFVKI